MSCARPAIPVSTGVRLVNSAFHDDCEVAVIGAGPYGLSLGAHLNSAGIDTRARRGLPIDVVSHTADHADLGIFRGQHVAVIGRGQSACESAALLAEAGAAVTLICRGDIHWLGAETSGNAHRRDLYWRLHKLL